MSIDKSLRYDGILKLVGAHKNFFFRTGNTFQNSLASPTFGRKPDLRLSRNLVCLSSLTQIRQKKY